MECTHHGPTAVAVPITFVEIGSDEAAWADDDAARAVARSIATGGSSGSTPRSNRCEESVCVA
ncbi:MAG: D-aminoacyl-tRNA deacylase [Halofilum sp. (in: g-proteobacteria)]